MTLHLTLKKKWFDMIASGEKKEEYREMKLYWTSRLTGSFSTVTFRNGYRKDSPTMEVEIIMIWVGRGNPDWGAPVDQDVYIIRLGDILKINGLPKAQGLTHADRPSQAPHRLARG